MTLLFLLQENGGFLLQENGGKIIIAEDTGGSSYLGSSKAVGYSAVKKQLGMKPTESIRAFVTGKLLLSMKGTTKSLLPHIDTLIPPSIIRSKLLINESHLVTSKIVTHETLYTNSKILRKETAITKSKVLKHPTIQMLEALKELHDQQDYFYKEQLLDKERRELSKMADEKKNKISALVKVQRILTEDIRKTPSINVDLNEPIHQRGDLMRITANMSQKSGNIYMRIISDKGIIVQKAGLVKKNATGFQILTGTRDLKAGKYFVQVSNHDNFSPLGVAEFTIKGDSPILPFIPVIPFLLTPDSPTGKFERFIFRTMQDSRVDSVCKKFENKKFKFSDKNAPIPPLHFNCRCWVEGIGDE